MDFRIVGRWQVTSLEVVRDRMIRLIGGKPGEQVEFTSAGKYMVGRRAKGSNYRLVPCDEHTGLDIWITDLESLTAHCLFTIDDDQMRITIAGDSGERPTRIEYNPEQLWCVMTLRRVGAGRSRAAGPGILLDGTDFRRG